VAQCLCAFNKSVYFWKSTVNLGFKLKTYWTAANRWDVLAGFPVSLDICLDKLKSMDTNPCTSWYLNNTLAIPDQFEILIDKLCILLKFGIHVALCMYLWNLLLDLQTLLLCYYEFYSRLQTTVQFTVACIVTLWYIFRVKRLLLSICNRLYCSAVAILKYIFAHSYILYDFEIYCNVWT
jgi:hypothetical protein